MEDVRCDDVRSEGLGQKRAPTSHIKSNTSNIFHQTSIHQSTDGAEPSGKAIDNLQLGIDNYGQHETKNSRLFH